MSTRVPFDAYVVALELARSLREPLVKLRRSDGDLARQVKRASASVVLNVKEGNSRVGKDRLHMFRVAAGSAAEIEGALQYAVAIGELSEVTTSAALALADRQQAILYRLTNPR